MEISEINIEELKQRGLLYLKDVYIQTLERVKDTKKPSIDLFRIEDKYKIFLRLWDDNVSKRWGVNLYVLLEMSEFYRKLLKEWQDSLVRVGPRPYVFEMIEFYELVIKLIDEEIVIQYD